MQRFLQWLITISFLLCSGHAIAEETLGISKTQPATGASVKIDGGYMVPYQFKIPGTDATVEMVPIPGGTFKLGSPASDKGHTTAEAPQVTIVVEPFWMAKHETTWGQYDPFLELYDMFKQFEAKKIRNVNDDNRIDAITAPTPMYDPRISKEYGEDPRLPAVTMTPYAAQQYTKWISGITSNQYRLPSEAEWEYAARAGAKTAYHFGNDETKLGDYAWFFGNADETPHFVGLKKPNPFGLYDMHGNVWEIVLDQYSEAGHQRLKGKKTAAVNAIAWPTKSDPWMVKGGGWDDNAKLCRAASKMGTNDDDWKAGDANLPLSPWWFTDYPSLCVGFRMIRPLQALPKEKMTPYWDAKVEGIVLDVEARIEEGRGVLGLVDQELPAAIKKIKEERARRKR
ncbi:MAG: transcriptional regulator [Blastopirellula sp.]|nr:MAG: transcriptional regulator [Blastopirellula sp.]